MGWNFRNSKAYNYKIDTKTPRCMKINRLKNLNRLINPKNIAVFGGRDAEIVISQCKKMGFKGKIWPVNPKRKEINGIKCFSSVRD